MLAIAVLPAALPVTFGHLTGRPRAGWLLLVVMVLVFAAGLIVCDAAESRPPARYSAANLEGGNMEGKEVRLGIGGSVLAVTNVERCDRVL
jgi:potassium-transporting ATPase potassium-binding subunit